MQSLYLISSNVSGSGMQLWVNVVLNAVVSGAEAVIDIARAWQRLTVPGQSVRKV